MKNPIPQPAAEARCARYSVTLNGQPVDVLAARVSAMPFNRPWPGHQRPLDQTEIAGFVCCESDGPLEVCVTVHPEEPDAPAAPNDPGACAPITTQATAQTAAPDGANAQGLASTASTASTAPTAFPAACVRPLSKHIRVQGQGATLRFTLPGPGQYVLEPQDFHRALHLFVAPPVQLPPADAPDTLRYGPGVHTVGLVELHSHQTVILEAGAVVYGGFVAFGASDITITGPGILDGSREVRTDDTELIPALDLESQRRTPDLFLSNDRLRAYLAKHHTLNGCVRLYNCHDCRIQHITCRDAASFAIVPAACQRVHIEDVKTIGMWRYNSDGVDFFNCQDCTLQNSFLRNFDDCAVIKGIGGWGRLPNKDLTVEGCVVWCDWGRALEIGAETNASEYADIAFRDCDVIHGCWLQLDIQHHNDAAIHDILFEDIRCEYTAHQLPMKMQADDGQRYHEAPTREAQPPLLGAFFCDMGLFGPGHGDEQIRRLRYRRIQVLADEGLAMPPCLFEGLNERNRVEDVRLEGLTFNGCPLPDAEAIALRCNAFVRDVVVTADPTP